MSDNGIHKGAVLMLALGANEAAEVMKYLGPREVQKLGAAMSTMKAIQSEELVAVLSEFRGETEKKYFARSGLGRLHPRRADQGTGR